MKTTQRQIEEITNRANTLYERRKIAKHGRAGKGSKIQLDSAWCMMEAIVERLGARIELLEDQVRTIQEKGLPTNIRIATPHSLFDLSKGE